jgi:outer membrane protein TolC
MQPVRSRFAWLIAISWTALVLAAGCLARRPAADSQPGSVDYTKVALQTEYADVAQPHYEEVAGPGSPRSIRDNETVKYRDVTLQEAIELALMHSRVMVDLGGTVIRAPEGLPTTYGPAVVETDPQFGVEGALSAFDADFASSLFFEKNDRRYNNQMLGDAGFFTQDYDIFKAEISKRAVTGSQFAVRNITDFDNNNALGNQFRHGAWDVLMEAEVKHPFLRGGGVEYNRIVGPKGVPGVYNGVLIARIRTDKNLAEFQAGVRDLLSNVENAYWDLYFSYRDLDTKIRARDLALETWRRVQALYRTGRRGGEAEKEAQAREQFFRFEEEVQNALVGRPLEQTQTNNGSRPGTFRGLPGVYVNERRLRWMIGLPPNEDYLLRPADEPPVAAVGFDWPTIAAEAIVQREELRRQRWEIKRRELEFIASKNYLLPSLDFFGRYRWRGFGDKLINSDREGLPPFDNAFADLTDGRFQEWQVGMELSFPIGFREGHAAVRNAELQLAQAKSVLREQERQVAHDLSTAVSELDRAYAVIQTEINRLIAAKQQLDALQAAYDSDKAEFFVVLDAQRRLAEAETRYYQARVEYAVALRNVHFEKGSLLDYCGVGLSEGPWPAKAYLDAAQRERRRMHRMRIDYRLDGPNIVSTGIESAEDVEMPAGDAFQGPPASPQPPSEPAGPPDGLDPGKREPRALGPVPDAPAPPDPPKP